MKNLPLYLQVWFVCLMVIATVFLSLAIALPLTLKSFFTDQVYSLITDAQGGVILISDGKGGDVDILRHKPPSGFDPKPDDPVKKMPDSLPAGISGADGVYTLFMPPEKDDEKETFPHRPGAPFISHFFIQSDGEMPTRIPQDFAQSVKEHALAQKAELGQYQYEYKEKIIFYVVAKVQRDGVSGWLVSYAWSSFRNDQVSGLWDKLMVIMIVVMLISLLPSIILARLLTRPLVAIEAHVSEIAHRKWDTRLNMDRNDEIGRLAKAVDQMRDQLVEHEKMERGFLQSLSHDLKTPVMLIKSYARAIRDGIHPKGTAEASAQIIETEASRLEKRIANILWINKVNYLTATSGQQFSSFSLDGLVEDIVDLFKGCNDDIKWETQMDSAKVYGDSGQIRVLLENTFDNMLRYAESKITVEITSIQGQFSLAVRNDGPSLDEELLQGIFATYSAGKDGEFGLGLSVAKMIADFHGFSFGVDNCSEGVEYRLSGAISQV